MLESLFWAGVVTVATLPLLLFVARDRVDAASGSADQSPLSQAPCHHVVPRDVAEFVIPDFRPGIDTCQIELHDPEAEFDALVDDGGVRFQFLDGASFLEVVFPGLHAPPFQDTTIFGPGAVASGRKLSDLVGTSTEPVSGPKFFRVRSKMAAFQRFRPDTEVVEVWVPPDADILPRIDVRPSADGIDSEILIDGKPAARLGGAPQAGVQNIRIVRLHPGDGREAPLASV